MNTLRRLSRVLQQVNAAIFLHAAYIIGIGVVSLLGRAIGVKFLDERVTKTNWKTPTGSKERARMY